jgi:hypothetical protein
MSENQPKQRGTLLTLWLSLLLLANAFILFVYILVSFLSATNNPVLNDPEIKNIMSTPLWNFILGFIFEIVVVCSIVALFKWIKWGFYTILILTVAGLTINVALGIFTYRSLLPFIGIVVLYLLLRSKWKILR